MTPDTHLQELFLDGLRDMTYTEHRILKALPRMVEAARSPDLRQAFQKHLVETERQAARLDDVFALVGLRSQARTCQAIDGILAEGDGIAAQLKGTPAIDTGLIGAAQTVEHHEIARYGALVRLAGQLGLTEAGDLLAQSLAEEKATDEALESLAHTGMRAMA